MTRAVYLDRELAFADVGSVLAVAPDVAHHLRVSRVAVGEEFDLVDGTGRRLQCVLHEDAHTTAEAPATVRNRRPRRRGRDESAAPLQVRVLALTHETVGQPELVLIQALAKGGRDEQAIESATEIGVDRVIPWAAGRSIADWPSHKEEKQRLRWHSLLDAATQQSRRARAPYLAPLARGRQILAQVEEGDLLLVLHEDATDHLADVLDERAVHGSSRVVLVVGPEGGISPEELDAFAQHGGRPVLLGPTVLRASSAGPAGLALVQAAVGRWRGAGAARR